MQWPQNYSITVLNILARVHRILFEVVCLYINDYFSVSNILEQNIWKSLSLPKQEWTIIISTARELWIDVNVFHSLVEFSWHDREQVSRNMVTYIIEKFPVSLPYIHNMASITCWFDGESEEV